jgi:hypothetical protein
MKKLLPPALCLLVLSACATDPQPQLDTSSKVETSAQSPEERQLLAAEAKWQKNKPSHYSYILQRSCFCPKEYNQPIEIRVLNGVVQRANLPEEDSPLPAVRMDEALTINDLFATVHKAVDKKAAKINVQYDWHYGYPTSIAIDWDKMMADEETYFTAKYLKPL